MVDLPTRERVAFCRGCSQPIIGGHRLQGTAVRDYWSHTDPTAERTRLGWHAASPIPMTVITL